MTQAIQKVLAGQAAWHIETCDVLDGLRALPERSIHMAVTSPPYWALRDYKIEPSVWGGDPDCRHDFAATSMPGGSGNGHSRRRDNLGGHARGGLQPGYCRCGAWQGCFGLEPSPELYVEHAVTIFRELRRVLRDDGTLWLNLGDSYADAGKNGGTDGNKNLHSNNGTLRSPPRGVLKSGDLVNLPHRVAEALQADGWYWRATIVWAKRSPMPESVAGWRWVRHRVKVAGTGYNAEHPHPSKCYDGLTMRRPHSGGVPKGGVAEWNDCPGCKKCRAAGGYVLRKGSWRPTTSHEYLFMLTKSADYFCDGEAVREACVSDGGASFGNVDSADDAAGNWAQARRCGRDDRERYIANGRNMRGVWWLSSAPFPEAHFATFPPEVPRRCILAGTSDKGYCAGCGEPWAPVVETSNAGKSDYNGKFSNGDPGSAGRNILASVKAARDAGGSHDNPFAATQVIGWRPTCACGCPETTAAIVLDPFAGAGTTGLVAQQLGRRFIGFERSPKYTRMARKRITNRGGTPGLKPLPGQRDLFEAIA